MKMMSCFLFNLNYIYFCLFYCTIDWWDTFLMIGPFSVSFLFHCTGVGHVYLFYCTVHKPPLVFSHRIGCQAGKILIQNMDTFSAMNKARFLLWIEQAAPLLIRSISAMTGRVFCFFTLSHRSIGWTFHVCISKT